MAVAGAAPGGAGTIAGTVRALPPAGAAGPAAGGGAYESRRYKYVEKIDYARLKLVLDDGTSAAGAFLSSAGFSLSRLRRTISIYAVPTVASVALLGLSWLVVPWSLINAPAADSGLAQYREPLAVALLFLGQQVVMFGRYWLRVAGWASAWSYYSASR